MNILLLGSGGREHALAWKIAASPLVTKLWCAPGNAGIAREAECVALDVADHAAVIEFCRRNAVDLVVVGPETPLAAGIVDDLAAVGIKAFGPSQQAAQLEGSKGFTKDLCSEFNIPTGAYRRFDNAKDAVAYVRAQGAPIVVKADGLAAGKGVVVAQTLHEAEAAVAMMFEGAFGAAGAEVVTFSPLADESPDADADVCWLPGGYPELHAGRLAANRRFLDGVRAFAGTKPVHGECGGYMVLGAALTDADGARHEMVGLLGLETSYAKRRMHLGYRLAELAAPMPGYGSGARLRGHEFHYSTIISQPDTPLAVVRDATGTVVAETGSRRGHATGTFFHLIAEDR